MKKLSLLLLFAFLLFTQPGSIHIRRSGGGGGGGSFVNCATSGGSMAYCQDFETTGGGNPLNESPAAASNFNLDCDYATSPAPLSGSQSCYRNASGSYIDESAYTAISSSGWWQATLNVGTLPADGTFVFGVRASTSGAYPRLLSNNGSGSVFQLVMLCDGTFGGGTQVTSSNLTLGSSYVAKMEWDPTDGTGELFLCAYSGNSTASCTTSQGTCNGTDGQSSPDGLYLQDTANIVYDDLFASTTNPSP